MTKITCLFAGLIACYSIVYAKIPPDGSADPEIPKKQYFTKKLNADFKFDVIPDEPD